MHLPKLNYRKFRLPREWSNHELKKFTHLFTGDVINVSGWDDRDKEGGFYRQYFKSASRYYISNYRGTRGAADAAEKTDFFIDLEAEIPEELKGKFDVVFNHTTLEHIFDVFKAFQNLCLLSKDVVIVVVPFTQQVHTSDSFSDYWRFTPHAVEMLFNRNGMHIVYVSANNHANCANYVIAVGARYPEKWKDKFPESKLNFELSNWIGEPALVRVLKKIAGIF